MIHPPRIGLDSLILFFFILNESYQSGFSISPHDSIFNISKKKKRFLIFIKKRFLIYIMFLMFSIN
jgi:hypothetical protein